MLLYQYIILYYCKKNNSVFVRDFKWIWAHYSVLKKSCPFFILRIIDKTFWTYSNIPLETRKKGFVTEGATGWQLRRRFLSIYPALRLLMYAQLRYVFSSLTHILTT